jgi:hypothetical protein
VTRTACFTGERGAQPTGRRLRRPWQMCWPQESPHHRPLVRASRRLVPLFDVLLRRDAEGAPQLAHMLPRYAMYSFCCRQTCIVNCTHVLCVDAEGALMSPSSIETRLGFPWARNCNVVHYICCGITSVWLPEPDNVHLCA